MNNRFNLNDREAKVFERFKKFIGFRNKFSLFLSVIVLVCYYIFIIVVGFFPQVLGYTIGPSVITLGILSGISIIIISIIVTGIYTFIANKYFDRDQKALLDELSKEGIIEKITKGEIK